MSEGIPPAGWINNTFAAAMNWWSQWRRFSNFATQIKHFCGSITELCQFKIFINWGTELSEGTPPAGWINNAFAAAISWWSRRRRHLAAACGGTPAQVDTSRLSPHGNTWRSHARTRLCAFLLRAAAAEWWAYLASSQLLSALSHSCLLGRYEIGSTPNRSCSLLGTLWLW